VPLGERAGAKRSRYDMRFVSSVLTKMFGDCINPYAIATLA
jgi:hypothetical protein